MSEMADPLLKALKTFLVVGGVVLVLGTTLLIWLVVKRGETGPGAAAAPASIETRIALPPAAEVSEVSVAGSRLLLFGRSPQQGQFVAVVDLGSGELVRLLRLEPAAP